ncbi:MAG: alkaline phosphatase family protein [Leptospira sp.]|nr:alkaline phosphatase family protein [Leptospira sp.]
MKYFRKFTFAFLIFLILISEGCSESKLPILSGPMVGAVAMRSAKVWVQLDYRNSQFSDSNPDQNMEKKNLVTLRLKKIDHESSKSIFSFDNNSQFIQTTISKKNGIALFELKDLEPGTEYHFSLEGYTFEWYRVKGYKNAEGRFKTKPFWKFRNPNPPNFKFVFASCHYVNEEPYDRKGKPWGANYEIFQHIEKENPEFFLWVGDNVYLREPDWDSPSGILHRYSHTRALEESKIVFNSMPHFAIWDDHDFGPNDASLSYSLSNTVEETFKDFWPDFNYPIKGIYRNFTWGDAEFFLLDNRTFRTANRNQSYGKRTILGDEQLEWLFNALADSNARFKFIVMGGQFLNSAAVYENYANYAEEKSLILDQLKKMKLKNVVFLTGDRHHSEVSLLEQDGSQIFDITISPLTAGIPGSPIQEKNEYRIPGSLIQERVFGVLEIEGANEERQWKLRIVNSQGDVLYSIPTSSSY